MKEQNSLSTRLNAYLMLDRVVLALDASDDDIIEEIRNLQDVLWRDLSNEDQEFLNSRTSMCEPLGRAFEAHRNLIEPYERKIDWDNLASLPVGDFKIVPQYDQDADMLSVFISDDPSFCDQINSRIAVYRSMQTKVITGFRVKILDSIQASCSRCENTENRLVNEKKELVNMFCVCLGDLHATLQGDLSYDKVNEVKRRIKLLLTRAKL